MIKRRIFIAQDISCPTCRTSLQESNRNVDLAANVGVTVPPVEGGADVAGAGDPANQRPANPASPPQRNHFFHFDGSRYVSWLPSFSVEVSVEIDVPSRFVILLVVRALIKLCTYVSIFQRTR